MTGNLVLLMRTTSSFGAEFEEISQSIGLGELSGGKAAWGDYDNDGWVDLYCEALWNNDGGKFTRVDGPFRGAGIWGDYDNDGDLDLYLYSSGTLLRNDGDDRFTDMKEILDKRPMAGCRRRGSSGP